MIKRNLHKSTRHNLFGGKSLKPSQQQLFTPPSTTSQKSKPPANPSDILKKNDILMYSSKPLNYIESIKKDGFHLANNLLITAPYGLVLINSESFQVNLENGYKNFKNYLIEFEPSVLEIFKKVHPKPEILVIGLGKFSRMLSENNRLFFSELGIQVEVSDSNNAGQIFDLLATERPGVIGALLLPPNV
ncbi:unnamed protein product [Candida verbasci]|uniref:NADH dehydrogenase [ubiquinone] 1 alpha subcomplex assembly factor 3 n=1 Tax=Candida verbasci TaxID=1227364 RepID=A0A9W4TWN0_9ASCO|nr:unnamed protein product [Candida verbasci]